MNATTSRNTSDANIATERRRQGAEDNLPPTISGLVKAGAKLGTIDPMDPTGDTKQTREIEQIREQGKSRVPRRDFTDRRETVQQDGKTYEVTRRYYDDGRVDELTRDDKGQTTRRPIGAERSALAFYNRMKNASDEIISSGLEDRMAKQNLAAQGQLRYAPNVLQTGEQQQYRQAQRAFTEARLRKESGAAINASEYDNDSKTYFAQPGDSPQVIEQKRRGRAKVLNGLAVQAGPAYDEYYGAPAPRDEGGAAEPPASKGVISRADLQQRAKTLGVSEAEAEQDATARGYLVK